MATAIIMADIVLKSRVYTPRELCAPKRWEPFRKSDSSCHHRKSKKNGELPLQGFPEQELAVWGAAMEGNPPQDSGRPLPHLALVLLWSVLTPGTSSELPSNFKVGCAYQGGQSPRCKATSLHGCKNYQKQPNARRSSP